MINITTIIFFLLLININIIIIHFIIVPITVTIKIVCKLYANYGIV